MLYIRKCTSGHEVRIEDFIGIMGEDDTKGIVLKCPTCGTIVVVAYTTELMNQVPVTALNKYIKHLEDEIAGKTLKNL